MTKDEQTEFWRRIQESKKRMHEKMAKLPYGKKVEILEKMQVNHQAMRTTKPIKPLTDDKHRAGR